MKGDFEHLEENLSAAKRDVDEEVELASHQKENRVYQNTETLVREAHFQRLQQTTEMQENQRFRSEQRFALAKKEELRNQQMIKDEGTLSTEMIKSINLTRIYSYQTRAKEDPPA